MIKPAVSTIKVFFTEIWAELPNGLTDEEMEEGVIGGRKGTTQASLPWTCSLSLGQMSGLFQQMLWK
jgi:hypothetical protein